ncbi:MAG TPA: ribbon-helix-helix protein, CopG family [Dehalococcoidia bacterium]|nr:ribbon-helix-helix protein, CopG family [Dehalococcoidia bacterium]
MKTPKPGFKQITLSEELKDQIQSRARAEGLTMPDLLRKLLETNYPDYPAPAGEEKEK